ncbi:class I adenylate cyclase [Shewanella eurypsychrophilus]|uniref:Adenylate cyclase n=1 Tax=Shewanella eurypsychrophilus TaxID=2593656 RepID=A0ABX6V294_9GAMM|nr:MULTISPECIES: class I adenylate cyclase [Shewanella]QFU21124.1 class I adenylate cyclase [Shewanella sp. YLB-09]QPG56415.1 class I adenylate cyclase [Shewanella eurypsychrophilus]
MQNERNHFIETAERLNRVRLARARALLSPLKRDLLSLIPLLFHYHRAGYPGYNGPMTPSGVFEYQPSELELLACETLGLVKPMVHLVRQAAIEGVYSMGSMSSFGQNPKSDIDVWLVHDRLLSPEECRLLQEKSALLTSWFAQHALEVNIYLVHPEQFIGIKSVAGEAVSAIGNEHSGSAQHWLLLEEFYRSQICLAGKQVAWWPKSQNIEGLLSLGSVDQIPACEYFGASLWQLYKGLDKPHKALLKVLLLESYASNYPNTEFISEKVWQHTIEGDFSSANDSYYLLYESIDKYLVAQQEPRRLEIARRCFYLKCGVRLSEPEQAQDWRYRKLSRLVESWNWSKSLLETLDNCEHWHCGQLQWFNEQLNELMLGSYQTLLQFASTHKLSESLKLSELGLLTRKLHTYFSSDSNQIIGLNRLWSESIAERHLTLVYSHNLEEYCLYCCPPQRKSFIGQRAVYQSRSQAKLLVWAVLNGVSEGMTQWYELDKGRKKSTRLTDAALRLSTSFDPIGKKVSNMDLYQPWQYRKLLFLLNFDKDSTSEWQGQEIMVDYLNANIFSLGRAEQNMLESIDLFSLNSWGEWHCQHFEGDLAILEVLAFITPGIRRSSEQVEIEVVSGSARLKVQFEQTVINLVRRAARLSSNVSSSSTLVYPLKVAKVQYGLFFNSKGMVYQDLKDAKAFYQQLTTRMLIELPRPNLGNEPLTMAPDVIQDFAARGAIQYFLRPSEEGVDVFVLNEHNELNHYIQHGVSVDELVSKVSHNHAFEEPETATHRFNLPQFFRLIRIDGRLRAIPFGISIDEVEMDF